jgi:hypothetical protein
MKLPQILYKMGLVPDTPTLFTSSPRIDTELPASLSRRFEIIVRPPRTLFLHVHTDDFKNQLAAANFHPFVLETSERAGSLPKVNFNRVKVIFERFLDFFPKGIKVKPFYHRTGKHARTSKHEAK